VKHLVSTKVPGYGYRKGWVPRAVEDFEDGGAFPEIHVAQYPLDMGRNVGETSNVVSLTVDNKGDANYGAIITQGRRDGVLVHTKHNAIKEKIFTDDELMKPSDDDTIKTIEETKRKLEEKLNRKIKTAYSGVGNKNVSPQAQNNSKYIKYTPGNTNDSHNSGSDTRIVRMVDVPKDPLEPPKFKHKKIPMGPSSPPVPVLHSPTKKLTKEERDQWRIPPCISNWKNNKGYMIPLDKRVASDGRGLQETTINDAHAKVAQALYSAESNARELVLKKTTLRQQYLLAEQEKKEEELRKTAQEARKKREIIQSNAMETETEDETRNRIERERLREIRRREREREHRLENRGGSHKKSKITRDQTRDIGEQLALGMVVPKNQEALYDQRLFNQSEGLDSGFGDDESYNIYDRSLFGGERETALYRAPKRDDENYGETVSIDSIVNTRKFKPDRDFEGVDRTQPIDRSGPVQFEADKPQQPEFNDVEEKDIYGFDSFLNEVKGSEKPKEDRLKLGVMHATGGSGVGGEISDSRRNMEFVKSGGISSRKYRSKSPEKRDNPEIERNTSEKKSSPEERRRRSRSPPKRKRSPNNRRSRSPKRRRSRSPRRYDRSRRDSRDRSRGRR
jgi:SNW domain-containing protein 1